MATIAPNAFHGLAGRRSPKSARHHRNHARLEILVWFDTAYLQANYMDAVIPSEALKMV